LESAFRGRLHKEEIMMLEHQKFELAEEVEKLKHSVMARE